MLPWLEYGVVAVGTFLQVWGVRVTARELIIASDSAGGTLWVPRILKWITSTRRESTTVHPAAAAVAISTHPPHIRVTGDKPEEGDLVSCLRYLRRRVDQLDADVSALQREVDRVEGVVADIRSDLKRNVVELRRDLERSTRSIITSSAQITLRGVVWILAGLTIVLASTPLSIASNAFLVWAYASVAWQANATAHAFRQVAVFLTR